MSGLFSDFLLDSVGFHNYEIIEANDRLGGYVSYFDTVTIPFEKWIDLLCVFQPCSHRLLWKA